MWDAFKGAFRDHIEEWEAIKRGFKEALLILAFALILTAGFTLLPESLASPDDVDAKACRFARTFMSTCAIAIFTLYLLRVGIAFLEKTIRHALWRRAASVSTERTMRTLEEERRTLLDSMKMRIGGCSAQAFRLRPVMLSDVAEELGVDTVPDSLHADLDRLEAVQTRLASLTRTC